MVEISLLQQERVKSTSKVTWRQEKVIKPWQSTTRWSQLFLRPVYISASGQCDYLPFLHSFTQQIPHFFLMLPQTGFCHLQKKKRKERKEPNYYTFQKKILFFSWIRISFSFCKYHHTVYGKEGKPSGFVEECVRKIQKTHASKWKRV